MNRTAVTGKKPSKAKQPACTCPEEDDLHEFECAAYQWNVERFLEWQRAAKEKRP